MGFSMIKKSKGSSERILSKKSDSSSKRNYKGNGKSAKKSNVSMEDRYTQISKAAYFIAEQRGFTSGNELDDWLRAEAEVSERLHGADQ